MTGLQNAESWAAIGGFIVILVGSAIKLSKRNRQSHRHEGFGLLARARSQALGREPFTKSG